MALVPKVVCGGCGYVPIDPQLELDRDHIKPQSVGGKSTAPNTQVLCVVCHRKKSILDADPHHESYYTILESAPGLKLSDALHQ
jgi:5-methylcytosine-specific restriction endonuclease McrA